MRNNAKNITFQAFLIAITLLLFTERNGVKAQDVSFIAEAPGAVRAGEQFQIVYSLNEKVDNFTPPDFGDFQYLGGPATGSSTSIQMINGRTTQSSTYTFTYYIQAPGAGRYTIAPATANYKKNNIQSNSVTIEVAGTSQNPAAGSSNNPQQSQNSTAEVSGGGDIFMRLEVDKKSAFVGEAIAATVKIYSKLAVAGIDQLKGLDFSGFYKQDIAIPNISGVREKVGNDIYMAYTLQRVVLFPQRGGELTIESFDLLVEVQKQVRRQSQNIFDDFFGPSYQRSRVNLKSLPVKLVIKQLPGNQPSDFAGAVGKFSITATANPADIKTNDAVTFKVTISGKGNVRLLEGIKTNFPPSFEVYEPVVKTNIDNNGQIGTKTLEYTAIARHAGKFTVPPFSLIYFDVNDKEYKSISSQDFEINVEKSANDTSTVIVSNLSKEDVKLLGSDIRYIETQSNLHYKRKFIFGSFGFIASYLISLLVFIVLLFLWNEKIKGSADTIRMRNRKAGKVATKRLKKARQILKTGDKDKFYEELGKALWGYLSDKLSIPLAELSKDKVVKTFNNLGIDENYTSQFFDLSERSEYARYAPGEKEVDMPDMLKKAEKLISNLDQNI